MGERRGRSSTNVLETGERASPSERLGEERARQILERAAALDAERSSEIEITQLREAAAAAGISPESFDRAIREHSESGFDSESGAAVAALRAPGPVAVAHYADLLRDLLGNDARISVVEDRIEGRDDDGLTVSIRPSSGEATAAVVAEGSLRRRILAIVLPALAPAFFAFLLATEDEAGLAMMLGVFLTVLAAIFGTSISSRRERKQLEKKADRVRRQLQRMLGAGS